MARLFVAYASPDTAFALRLAEHLRSLGHQVWIDQWEIMIGDSIQGKIETGIDQAEYLIVVLSRHTPASVWVEREVQVKMTEELTKRRPLVFPVLLEDCTIPPFMRPKRVADFRNGYEIGLVHLSIALTGHSGLTHPQASCTGATLPDSLSVSMSYDDDMDIKLPRLTELNVELGLPHVGSISGVWKPDHREQEAAWELYVELATRVTLTGLKADEGLLRESLTSLYTIFTLSREILKKYGPNIARRRAQGELSFGFLALNILNYVIRPVLATWHPRLLDYEHTRSASTSVFDHEQQWRHAGELRTALNDARVILLQYADILAQVAGVPQLLGPNDDKPALAAS